MAVIVRCVQRVVAIIQRVANRRSSKLGGGVLNVNDICARCATCYTRTTLGSIRWFLNKYEFSLQGNIVFLRQTRPTDDHGAVDGDSNVMRLEEEQREHEWWP